MKPTVPSLLSFNAGYVDTAGFLALHGLFTAHVTGNFVTFGAAVAHGSNGALAKLLALPVFCLVVIVTRLAARRAPQIGTRALVWMLALKTALLALSGAFMLAWGPFDDPDAGKAILAGMTLVAAMAIQNAAHRVHLAKAPPTTLMTGTSTQIMLDVADLIAGPTSDKERADVTGRLKKMIPAVLAFAAGCAAAALLFVLVGLRAFLLPPLVSLATLVVLRLRPDPDIAS